MSAAEFGRWRRWIQNAGRPPGPASSDEAVARLEAVATEAGAIIDELACLGDGHTAFGAQDVQALAAGILDRAYDAMAARDRITGRRDRRLARTLDRLAHGIGSVLREDVRVPPGPPALDFSRFIDASPALVGGRLSRLARIRHGAGVPGPDGFAVTSQACHALLRQPGPWEPIQRACEPPADERRGQLTAAAEDIRSRLLDTPWPPPVGADILGAYDRLVSRAGARRPVRVAVGPSAADEDGRFGVPRPYESILNVDRDHLLAACREAVAAQVGPSLVYCDLPRHSPVQLRPIAVSVTQMVDILASGVLHSRLPGDSESDAMLIRGAWGLTTALDEDTAVDRIRISRGTGHHIVLADIADKARMRLAGVEDDVITVSVPGWMREQPCLTRPQAASLAEYGMRLEGELGGPQDVDWVLDRSERILVIRSRPVVASAHPDDAGIARHPLLRRTRAVATLVTPLTPVPVATGEASSDRCVTVHDVLCCAYERGMAAAGRTGTSATWPRRTGDRP